MAIRIPMYSKVSAKGAEEYGGGLGNRGVLHEPQIIDKSQKTEE
jgi:hypothetical protein